MTPTAEPIEAPPKALMPLPLDAAETWVLLWSHSQNCTHVEPLSRMFDTNRRAYTNNTPMDYIPLHIGTSDEVHAMSSSLRQTLIAREAERSPALTDFMRTVLHPKAAA